jgi:hypothetical protein
MTWEGIYDYLGNLIDYIDLDTWCQAKYAMEVFGAMLGERDEMNIYVMSDFDGKTTDKPKLTLYGNKNTAENVKKIHDMEIKTGTTPFATVRKAYNDLNAAVADEKWLVVLTDGKFQENGYEMQTNEIDTFFDSKKDDIKIMFLGIGPQAGSITSKANKHIYFEKANDSSQILSKITDICTRIYNRNKLAVDITQNTFNFDVPMGELIVFAQGEKVSINGIKSSSGKTIDSSALISVKYSELPASFETGKVNTSLAGIIAEFNKEFDAGNYTVDISGAKTIEIYYKPNVEVYICLTDKSGKEVTDMTKLEAAEYTVKLYFINKNTKKELPASKLLGDIKYSAEVTINGVKQNRIYKSGEEIKFEEGEIIIEATGHYLDYNSVKTVRTYHIFEHKEIRFEIQENDFPYTVKNGKFENVDDHPITVKALIEKGKGNFVEFTPEQWKSMGRPEISFDDTNATGVFRVVKEENSIGIFKIYPEKYEPTKKITYGEQTLKIKGKYAQKHGDEWWRGSFDDTNTKNTEIELTYTKDGKLIRFEIQENPEYARTAEGLKDTGSPIIVKALIENDNGEFGDYTLDQWGEMGIPEVTLGKDVKLGKLRVEQDKNDVGIFRIYPTDYSNINYLLNAHGVFPVNISYEQQHGNEKWIGDSNTQMTVKNEVPWWIDFLALLIVIAVCVGLFLLVLWIMTRKVYPNSITAGEVEVHDNGVLMPPPIQNDRNQCCECNLKKGVIGRFIHLFVSEGQKMITFNKPNGYLQGRNFQTFMNIRPASRRYVPPRLRRFVICSVITKNPGLTEFQAGAVFESHEDPRYFVLPHQTGIPIANIVMNRETTFANITLSNGIDRVEIQTRKT